MVLIRTKYETFVSNVFDEGIGISGKSPNKGATGLRFDFQGTDFCFICSHFTAHIDNCEDRNKDFHKIMDDLIFDGKESRKKIFEHDNIFWMGDLNYRIDKLSRNDILQSILTGNCQILRDNDQLSREMKAGHVFHHFQEGEVRFRPTYKFDNGTDDFDTVKERHPAWTDRILWLGTNIEQFSYCGYSNFVLSDHKPVSALFEVGILKKESLDETRESFEKKQEQIEKRIERLELLVKEIHTKLKI